MQHEGRWAQELVFLLLNVTCSLWTGRSYLGQNWWGQRRSLVGRQLASVASNIVNSLMHECILVWGVFVHCSVIFQCVKCCVQFSTASCWVIVGGWVGLHQGKGRGGTFIFFICIIILFIIVAFARIVFGNFLCIDIAVIKRQ